MRLFVVLLLLSVVACRPKPRVPGTDSTAVVLDTVARDSGVVDTTVWPTDYEGVEPAAMTDKDVDALVEASKAPRPRAAPVRSGLPFGFSGYKPTDRWCVGFLNASNMTISPSMLLKVLQAADKCGYRFAPAMERAPTRTNGKWNGPFDLGLFKQYAKRFSDALTEAQWAYYGPKIPYIYGMDDMGCPACNGGTAISQQTTAEMYAYLQTLTMAKYVPMALRVHDEWMLRNGMTKAMWSMPDGSPRVDRTISQWYSIFQTQKPYRTQTQWYAAQAAAGPKVNVPTHSFTVAYGGCYKAGLGDGCPADKLKTMGMIANAYPDNCENVGWNYRDEFGREPWLSKIRELATDAAGRTPPAVCRVS